MRYRAVVFDLFGTLIDNFTLSSMRAALEEMALVLRVPREGFVQGWLASYEARNRGAFASPEGNVRHVCELLQVEVSEETLAAAGEIRLDFTRSCLVPRIDALPTLKTLREQGRKLALVSDCSSEVPTLWRDTPFASLFDATVFSCELQAKKPEPVMYLAACEGLGVPTEACLYVGDGSSNELAGAAAVGMHPVLIRMPHEEHPDAYRPGEAPWDGPTIRTLSEVLALME